MSGGGTVSDADIMKVFDALDGDHSGSISSSELRAAFARKGLDKDAQVRYLSNIQLNN